GIVWWMNGTPSSLLTAWHLVLFVGTPLLAGRLGGHAINRLRRIARTTAERRRESADWLDQPGDFARREILRRALGIGILVGFGGAAGGWLLRRSRIGIASTEAGRDLDVLRRMLLDDADASERQIELAPIEPLPPFIDDFPVPDAVRPRLTPTDRFYTVDISTRDPNIPHDDWSLTVNGLVDRPLEISYPELLAYSSIELDGTLMCISYEYGTGLISTTRWTGVRLRDVLQRAGIRDGAVDLALYGAGGYSDSIPVNAALDPRTILAYGMDGEALTREHGFPCRLYVPNLYGEKNVKWLQRIEVVDFNYRGFWQERGWTDKAIINTVSVIDTPAGRTSPDAEGVVPIAGIAFAGSRGISEVEIRIDDQEWLQVDVEEYAPELVWQRWRYGWRPAPGEYEITVRATDGDGNRQIEEVAPPHPDGMTGLQTIRVTVE
ncbi:MAG: molybdopterin-dependent oxidoreductase, partial [Chloroflexota bacterium]